MPTTDQLNGALAGRYTVEREIGAGGMATVFLARDVRHNRQVALKVLNPELGAVLGVERFMAEIEVTANLHHPNLLPLFDSGEANGLLFYVMPFVEGETLRARLQRERQLGVDEAVRIAVAIAGALDYAHRHAVIHRDLKPENILLHEGQPLVMDFGIALAVSKAGGARITQTGLSLGTPQYMSPEQATGDHAMDGRTDIYSLGAVLYEMLVGDPPHTGSTVQSVIAKVITERPASVRATRPNVPEHVESALMTALAKLPADRFASAADFSAAVTGQRPVAMPVAMPVASSTAAMGSSGGFGAVPGATGASAGASAGAMRGGVAKRELAAWALAIAALGAAAWSGGVGRGATTADEGIPVRYGLVLPEGVEMMRLGGATNAVALSDDGSLFAIAIGEWSTAAQQLYLRRADDPTMTPIRGTENAYSPSFSPNGDWILFWTRQGLWKIPTSGGTAVPVVRDVGLRRSAASWGDGDVIVYAADGALWETSAAGSDPRVIARPDSASSLSYLFPHLLPGGRDVVFTIFDGGPTGGQLDLAVVPRAGGAVRRLGLPGAAPKFVAPDRLVFSRGANGVYSVPFAPGRATIEGEPVRVIDGVAGDASNEVAVARNGWFAYLTGDANRTSTIVLADRSGRSRVLRAQPSTYTEPRVSPDGKRIAVAVGGEQFNRGDIWMLEVADGAWYRVTSDGVSYRPAWSADGSRVLYVNGIGDSTRILSRSWDGTGEAAVLLERGSLAEIEPGRAGGLSAVRTLTGPRDIHLAPTESLAAMRPFVAGPANETAPVLSPDGRWLAYVSDESGRREVYARRIDIAAPRLAVSLSGGTEPRWGSDSRTLYYRGDSSVMAATLAAVPPSAVTGRAPVFRDAFLNPSGDLGRGWDIFPGDRQFVFLQGVTAPDVKLYMVVNGRSVIRGAGTAGSER